MQSHGREIQYSDEWDSGKFYQNSLYNPKPSESDDYDSIPYPLLRSEIEQTFKGLLRERKRPKPAKLFFDLLLQIFAPATTTTEKPDPTDPVTEPSGGAQPVTLGSRTRRPPKYKIKGYCKHPPKKHLKENEDDDEE